MTASEVLDKAITDITTARTEIGRLLTALTPEQLLWKPAPDKWSIAIVASHLINNNAPYFDVVLKKMEGYKGTSYNNRPYKPTFWGGMLYNMVRPDSLEKRKLKTPKPFRPVQNPDLTLLAQDFDDNQQELIEIINHSRGVDVQKVFVRSPAMWLMRFHIADAFAALSVHELRHLKQVQNIMKAEGFPG